MPTYQYRCLNCRKRFDYFLAYSEYGVKQVHCPHCASELVQRRIGRIRFLRSEESRLDNVGDLPDLDGLEDDPQSLGRMMRKMSQETGENLGPEFTEVIDRLESGQSPEDIEKAMPDLPENPGAGETGGGLDDTF